MVIFPQHHVQTSLLSRFSRVRLCVTPQSAAHQVPPSLGFSRQEHWSGLPFPSPMHESEKWKWTRSVVSDSLWPHGLQPTRLLHPWDFPVKSTGVGYHCLLPQTSLKASNLSVTNSDKSAARPLSTSSNEWGETGDTYSGFVSFLPPLNSQSKIKTNEKRERIE